jgi:hypothetical protein
VVFERQEMQLVIEFWQFVHKFEAVRWYPIWQLKQTAELQVRHPLETAQQEAQTAPLR